MIFIETEQGDLVNLENVTVITVSDNKIWLTDSKDAVTYYRVNAKKDAIQAWANARALMRELKECINIALHKNFSGIIKFKDVMRRLKGSREAKKE